jgi:Holliday junction resolvase
MAEAKVQSKIITALTVIGCYVRKVVVSNRAGTHDLIACCKGKFYSIEVKDTNGIASPLQIYNRDKVIEAGGKSIVAKTVKEVIELIQEDLEND